MLLAVDVGNTSIKFGLFESDRLILKTSIETRRGDSCRAIAHAVGDRSFESAESVLVSSVVPEIDSELSVYLSHATGAKPRFITAADDFGLRFGRSDLETGTDRLLNSMAASSLYGSPCAIVSFGTATTLDVVGPENEYLGGLIAAGPGTAARALSLAAAKLPEVTIAVPEKLLNTSTSACIQAGIFYSQVGLVEKAIAVLKDQFGQKPPVVATGGFAGLIAPHCDSIDRVDEDLTLKGLLLLHRRLDELDRR